MNTKSNAVINTDSVSLAAEPESAEILPLKRVTPAPQPAVTKPVPASRLRKVAHSGVKKAVPGVLGAVVLIALWQIAALSSNGFPTPLKTWEAAKIIFAEPFYIAGPNDMGIGWNVLASLKRVALGFGLAALVGIPLGFLIGRFSFIANMLNPVIALLRPVSPLAWLPIGLLLFQRAEPASAWTIFICSIFPAVLPHILTGVRLSIGIAWLVIVAAEMLTGGVGIGFWIWNEWNNLNVENIIIAILLIGVVGMLLEQGLMAIARRFSYAN